MHDRTTIAAAVVLATVIGCTDRGPMTSPADGDAPADDGIAAQADGDVTASLSVSPAGDGDRDVTLVLAGEKDAPGAYQGRLDFAEDLLLVDVRTAGEGFHVVNRGGAEEGRLRFAGYAVHGLPSTGVLTFRFAADRPLGADDFRLELEVVGDSEGKVVPDERIRVAADLIRVASGPGPTR